MQAGATGVALGILLGAEERTQDDICPDDTDQITPKENRTGLIFFVKSVILLPPR